MQTLMPSENTGKKTSGTKTTLNAIVDLSEDKNVSANVNMFTELEYARVKYLVTKEKFNVPAAKKRATKELVAVFGAKVDDISATSISLDTTDAGSALLIASVLLQGDLSASKFGTRLADIADNFAENGSLSDADLRAELADWASKVDSTDNFAAIRANIKNLKLLASVPDFESFIYTFWTMEYRLGLCTDSLEETVVKNTNKKSDNYGAGYACTSRHWHKSTALDTDLGLCTAKKEGSFEERKQEKKDTEYYVCRAGTWNKITETQFELKECTEERELEYVQTKSDEYFVCTDKQWKELDAVTYELKLCTDARNLEFAKTEKSGSYVCEWSDGEGAWRKATNVEVELGVCGGKNVTADSIYKMDDDNYYVCSQGVWKAAEKLAYELQQLGPCAESNNLDIGETEHFGKYVCDNNEWREATEPESEFGVCGLEGVKADSIYKTSKSNYYVCNDGAWKNSKKDDYEFQQLGACTASLNLETRETESGKKFVCENSAWREPDEIESKIGVCGSSRIPTNSFDAIADKYYICLNKKWTETDSISYLLKTRCFESNKEKRMKTSSNDYYGCLQKSDAWNWTPITLVQYEYGFCSTSNSNNKTMKKASDNTYWYCNSNSWQSISDTVYSAGKFCNSSTDSTYSNGWTCVHTGSGYSIKYYWRTANAGEKATKLVCTKSYLKTVHDSWTCVASGWRSATSGEKATGLYCRSDILGVSRPNNGYACDVANESWRSATSLEIAIDTNCYASTLNNYRIGNSKLYKCTNASSHTWTEIPMQTLKSVYAGDYGGTNRYRNYRYITLGDTSLMIEPVKIRHSTDSATTWTCPGNISSECDDTGVEYDWAGALAIDKKNNSALPSPALSGHIQGACPSGWHVPNTTEGKWKSSYSDVTHRIDQILGWKSATQSAWLSYPGDGDSYPTQYTSGHIDYLKYDAWYMDAVFSIPSSVTTYVPSYAALKKSYKFVYCVKTK